MFCSIYYLSFTLVPMDTNVETETYEEWDEEAEVKKFLHGNLVNCGLMKLMTDYLHRVAQYSKCKW